MKNRQQGVTLIELMVAISILAILVSAGVPAFTSFVQNQRMTSTVNATIASLRMARAEAIRRNRGVTFCLSGDYNSCDDTATGFFIFEDDTNPKIHDASEEVLLTQDSPAPSVSLNTSDAKVRFAASGNADATRDFVICDSRGAEHARTLRLLVTGRVLNLGHRGDEACG